jgi:flagellar biosynthesis protein FlhA
MAPSAAKPSVAATLTRRGDWLLPVAAVVIVMVMIVPVPALLLDLLLATSITLSVIVLLAALQILRPVQFSVFPTLLLLLTLFRLSLNLASTRRILLHGSEGTAAAGHVIESFGQFVVGGNYVVGFVIFLALIAIQYLVINHGAVRTAEVSARFALDALPGKQMAIDADLNAGAIDERTARARREAITREAEFYGSMDGAARFSQRDALATILITAINIFAGFLIGVFQQNMPFKDALTTYTVLTVGDGLVTLIPSLLVSVAGGIVVTRASSDDGISSQLTKQLFSDRRPLYIASGVMMSLVLIPGLPKFSFVVLSAALAFLASRLPDAAATPAKDADVERKPGMQEQLETLLKLDDISVEVGYGLIPLVDQKQGGQMLPRIRALRRHLASELGFIVPAIHITDNMRLKPREYVLRLRGVEIARGETFQDWLLAISSESPAPPLEGIETREPAFGVPARWIQASLRDVALAAGYAVVEQTSVIATHLAEIIRRHAHEVLTRQETKRLLDALSESQPKLVEELVPRVLSLGEVEKILQQLLREQVSIRNMPAILETLIDASAVSRNIVSLVEAVRQSLGRALVQPLLQEDGKLKVLAVDPQLEEEIARAYDPQAAASGRSTGIQTGFLRRVLDGLRRFAGDQINVATPVLLCGSPARFHLRRMLEPFVPRVVVISPAEIPPVVSVQSLGVLQ